MQNLKTAVIAKLLYDRLQSSKPPSLEVTLPGSGRFARVSCAIKQCGLIIHCEHDC